MMASELVLKLQDSIRNYGDYPVKHGTSVGTELMAADVDVVRILAASNGSPLGMRSGEGYILLEMKR